MVEEAGEAAVSETAATGAAVTGSAMTGAAAEAGPDRAPSPAARTGWAGSLATAVGVAAAVGAAQLGVGYGLEIISWRPGATGLSTDAWLASLAWATWIAATSTIAGAVVAYRLSSRPAVTVVHGAPDPAVEQPSAGADRFSRGLWRLVLAASAALGGAITIALSAVPARMAQPAETSSPQIVAAGYAILGVLVGLLIAVGALTSRAVAANIFASAGWLWLLAVVAVVDGVLAGRDWERVPLAFWEFTATNPAVQWGVTAAGEQWFGNIFLPDAGLAAAAALVIGALAALPAARRGDHPVGVVLSGAAGPFLVAAAYLLAQPDLVGAEAVDLSRHLVAPYLVLTGLIGSLISLAVRPRTPRASRDPAPLPEPGEQPDAGPGAEPEPDESADQPEEEPSAPAPRGKKSRGKQVPAPRSKPELARSR